MAEPTDNEQEQLTQLVARLNRFIAAHDEKSADPVNPVRIIKARAGLAQALLALNRDEECLSAATMVIEECRERDIELGDTAGRAFSSALQARSTALDQLGRGSEARATDAEAIVRFRDSADAHVRANVARALGNHGRELMRRRETFGQGMAESDELVELIRNEPDESALEFAGLGIWHMSQLLAPNHPGPRGMAPAFAQMLRANVSTGAVALSGQLTDRLPTRLRDQLTKTALPHPRLPPGRLPAVATEALDAMAARARQALRVEAAVLARLYESDDPVAGTAAAQAEMLGISALSMLGHFRRSVKGMEAMNARRDPDVAAVYTRQVDESDLSGIFGQLKAIMFLNQRAEALVGDDPDLARVAYADSIDARLPARRAWLVRRMVTWFRPRRPRRSPQRATGAPSR